MKKLKQLIVALILKDIKGMFIWCDKCGSPFTRFYDVNKVCSLKDVTVDYTVECLACGSKAKVKEKWE